MHGLIEIREERSDDVAAVREVNRPAFGQDQESQHRRCLAVWVLGPMAVVPEYQRRGIGTKLIEAGNRKIKDAGYPFIIVVGDAGYYPQFGSRPAIEYGIK